MCLEFLRCSYSHKRVEGVGESRIPPLARLKCLRILPLEKGASLTGVAVSFWAWFTDKFRFRRGFDDDGIGVTAAFVRSDIDQQVVSVDKLSFCRFHFFPHSSEAKPQKDYHA
jgi:hypothetical protein